MSPLPLQQVTALLQAYPESRATRLGVCPTTSHSCAGHAAGIGIWALGPYCFFCCFRGSPTESHSASLHVLAGSIANRCQEVPKRGPHRRRHESQLLGIPSRGPRAEGSGEPSGNPSRRIQESCGRCGLWTPLLLDPRIPVQHLALTSCKHLKPARKAAKSQAAVEFQVKTPLDLEI